MDSDLFRLPALLADIAAIAGQAAAVAIATSFGGTTKEFPSPDMLAANPEKYANNWLILAVGPGTALTICRELFPRGGRAEIPTATRTLRRLYVKENSSRMSVPEMAIVLGTTERSVRQIRSVLRAAGMIP